MNFKIFKQDDHDHDVTKSMELKNSIKKTINISTTPQNQVYHVIVGGGDHQPTVVRDYNSMHNTPMKKIKKKEISPT